MIPKDIPAVLEEARAYRNRAERPISGIWSELHRLAEADYPPAKNFFIEGLDDEEWDWRSQSLFFLANHYPLERHGRVADKIRSMLLTDPSQDVRNTAAAVLSHVSFWLDSALKDALESDSDELVRWTALNSLLILGGLSIGKANALEKVARQRSEVPSWDLVTRTLRGEGLHLETGS